MNDRYLRIMESSLSAYPDSHIRRYLDEVKRNGLTEHGFPRLGANIGILIAYGQGQIREGIVVGAGIPATCRVQINVGVAGGVSIHTTEGDGKLGSVFSPYGGQAKQDSVLSTAGNIAHIIGRLAVAHMRHFDLVDLGHHLGQLVDGIVIAEGTKGMAALGDNFYQKPNKRKYLRMGVGI